MPQVNYRHMKKRREEQQKKEQSEKQARRGRVPGAQDQRPDPAPTGGSVPPSRGPT
jgi:hypothetical protein